MAQGVSVQEWMAMFREVGLDDDSMKKWHQIFESKHPEAHQSFLEWLELPPQEVERIRSWSR